MSAEADTRGLKRICIACSARFYDMNKRPIICPGCGEEFTGEVKIKTRKAKSSIIKDDVGKAIKAKAMEDSDDDDFLEEDSEEAQIVSLDDDSLAQDSSSSDDEEDTAAPDLDLDTGIGDLDDVDVDDDNDDEDDIDPDILAEEEDKDD